MLVNFGIFHLCWVPYELLNLYNLEHPFFVHVSPLVYNKNMHQQIKGINFILNGVPFVLVLNEFKEPRNYEIHPLTVNGLGIEVSIRLEHIKQRVCSILAPFFHEQFVIAISPLQVNDVLMSYFILELLV